MIDNSKGNLIENIKAIVSNRVDTRKDISDTEIRELITSVVFEKSQQIYLSIKEKQEIVIYF